MVTSIFQSFTYKKAEKTSWHRYGTKLRNCHPMYKYPGRDVLVVVVIGRIARITYENATYCYGLSGIVCLCVCLCVGRDRGPAKTDKQIEMPFWPDTDRLEWAR